MESSAPTPELYGLAPGEDPGRLLDEAFSVSPEAAGALASCFYTLSQAQPSFVSPEQAQALRQAVFDRAERLPLACAIDFPAMDSFSEEEKKRASLWGRRSANILHLAAERFDVSLLEEIRVKNEAGAKVLFGPDSPHFFSHFCKALSSKDEIRADYGFAHCRPALPSADAHSRGHGISGDWRDGQSWKSVWGHAIKTRDLPLLNRILDFEDLCQSRRTSAFPSMLHLLSYEQRDETGEFWREGMDCLFSRLTILNPKDDASAIRLLSAAQYAPGSFKQLFSHLSQRGLLPGAHPLAEMALNYLPVPGTEPSRMRAHPDVFPFLLDHGLDVFAKAKPEAWAMSALWGFVDRLESHSRAATVMTVIPEQISALENHLPKIFSLIPSGLKPGPLEERHRFSVKTGRGKEERKLGFCGAFAALGAFEAARSFVKAKSPWRRDQAGLRSLEKLNEREAILAFFESLSLLETSEKAVARRERKKPNAPAPDVSTRRL